MREPGHETRGVAADEIEVLRNLSIGSDLKVLDTSEASELRSEHPGLPDDYLQLLAELGYGSFGDGSFHLYSGPISPSDVFDEETAAQMPEMVLAGDDSAGGHLGYLHADGSWRLCFFDHGSLDDIEAHDEPSIVRFLISWLSDDEID
jgi:hypothetical protein